MISECAISTGTKQSPWLEAPTGTCGSPLLTTPSEGPEAYLFSIFSGYTSLVRLSPGWLMGFALVTGRHS